MNFLAHYVIATRFLAPAEPLPMYVAGTALPDLLPLASPHSRLRPALVVRQPALTAEGAALRAGVLAHLKTDAAFHKTQAFAQAQATVSDVLRRVPFDGIRVRRFFVSHVLTELALDAVLLRANPAIADEFYGAFADASQVVITQWTENTLGASLPYLPAVLMQFAHSRYLYGYAEDEGVATGLSRVCARARQDTFEGENHRRLVGVAAETVASLEEAAEALLAETAAALTHLRY